MSDPRSFPKFVRFALFQVDFRAGDLRKDGRKIRLQEQPFQVLATLLERAGEVVTREELQQKLWPADTFVDFDHGLNSAVARLREALNDSAERPKYIETVARRGYRFIGQVEEDGNSPTSTQLTSHHGKSIRPIAFRFIMVAVVTAIVTGPTWYYVSRRVESKLLPPRVVPLTSLPDRAEGAAFSPDGNRVAFARYSDSPEVSGIYIKQIGGDNPFQLTRNERGNFCCPVWSPDGRYIAFSRFANEEHAIYMVSAIGGAARKLSSRVPAYPALDWSTDGKFIAFSARDSDQETYSINLLSVETLQTRKLTEPTTQHQDWGPAFSPDGKWLAFIRINGLMTKGDDIFIIPADGGEAHRLTFDYASIPSPPAWTRDGRWIVFSSTRNSIPTLWRIPASGGSPVQIPQVGVVTKGPAVSPRGDLLAYDQVSGSSSIWSIEIGKIGKEDFLTRVTASKGSNRAPEFSPDGKSIAFQSDRSGTMEIWSCSGNGADPMKVTNFGGAQHPGPARWSPDSREIVFDSAHGEHNAIFLINAEGGLSRPLTQATSDNLNPSWSRDGKWIYFTSNRSGKWQIWKMPAGGGEPLQVTKKGGFVAFESADGKFIYYAKTSSDLDIWRMELDGRQESPVSPRIHLHQWTYWALADNGIFFFSEESSPHPVLKFFNFVTASTKDVVSLGKPIPWMSWISASANGKFVLYQQQDQVESNIMLLENFR